MVGREETQEVGEFTAGKGLVGGWTFFFFFFLLDGEVEGRGVCTVRIHIIGCI